MIRIRRAAATSAVLLAAGLLAGGVLVASPAHAEDGAVSATGSNTFTPARVAVLVGDSVTWTTTGGVNHTVTSSSANWRKDDAIALVGQSTSFTFSRAGTYTYYCKEHGAPTEGMRGSVVVTAPAQPSPSRTTAAPKPSPKPSASASPTRPASPRPTPSRTPSVRPTPSAPPSPSSRPSSAAPIGVPTSRPAPVTTSAAPLPSLAGSPDDPSPDASVDLGSGGLGPRPSTGRGRGLPTFLALVALGGVVSAQVRALLNLPVDA